MTADVAQSGGLPVNYKGVVVSSVQSGSPADKAGLKGTTRDIMGPNTHIGDIITAIDGHTRETYRRYYQLYRNAQICW